MQVLPLFSPSCLTGQHNFIVEQQGFATEITQLSIRDSEITVIHINQHK